MKYKDDKDLEFLKDVKSEDLHPLVQILIESKTEELTKRDIYITFNPKHNLYWKEIATELQYFGGNTIANIFRKEGVLYAEILRDVCTTLGIEYNTYLSTLEIEEILLSQDKKTGLIEKIKQTSRRLEYKDLLLIAPQTSIPMLLKKLADPAFRVTIDAVYEIANLRKKYQLLSKNCDSTESIEEEKTKNLELKYSQSFSISEQDSGLELAEFKIIDTELSEDIDFIDGSAEIDKTKQLFADTFKSLISIPNKTVELVFSPKVQEGLANGTYKLADNRAFVMNVSTGKIKEHAKILETGQARQLLTGGYHLLSIAVAQSHLADIEKSLSQIKSLVNDILENIEAEDKSKITGATEYIENIVSFIRKNGFNGELSEPKKNQIEAIIRDIFAWKNKLIEQFQTLNTKINNLGDKDTFGTKNTFEEIKEFFIKAEKLKSRYELFLKLVLLLTGISKIIDPLGQKFTNIDINLDEFKDKFTKYKAYIEEQNKQLKSHFNLDDTLEERKKVIQILQNKYEYSYEKLTADYQNKLQTIESYFNKTAEKSANMIFTFDENGNINKYAICNFSKNNNVA